MADTLFRPQMVVSEKMDATTQSNFNLLSKFIREFPAPAAQKTTFVYRAASGDDKSDVQTQSQIFVDLAPLKINFSTVKGGQLAVDADGIFKPSFDKVASTGIFIVLAINGGVLLDTLREFSTDYANATGTSYIVPIGTTWSGNIGPGAYEIKLQWMVSANAATAVMKNRALRVQLVENP